MATIKEVTALLTQVDSLDSPVWADLAQDDRAGGSGCHQETP